MMIAQMFLLAFGIALFVFAPVLITRAITKPQNPKLDPNFKKCESRKNTSSKDYHE